MGGGLLDPGGATDRRVAIVDDAINAGSAVSAAAEAITAAGGRIPALLALGATPATIAGIPVQSLATAPSHLWPAATCPRGAAAAPPSVRPT